MLPDHAWRRSRWVAVLLGAALTAPAGALDLISFSLHSRVQESGNTATVDTRLSLPGELYAPALVIEPGGAAPAGERTAVHSSKALWEAFLADDEPAILALWARAERNLVRAVLADPEARRLNRELLSAHQRKHVVGRVALQLERRYELLLVRRDDEPRELGLVESYVLEDGQWRATNELAGDRRFQIVWEAFRSGDVVASELPAAQEPAPQPPGDAPPQ